jgi:prepilin-type N-terminal cleavage/methylation domain-containing protein
MNVSLLHQSNRKRSFQSARILTCVLGFTLVEVLASVTIIGILIFMAIPSITSVRRDTEENMAISRAEALNMAISSYIQAECKRPRPLGQQPRALMRPPKTPTVTRIFSLPI